MSQRNPMNDRYQNDELKGQTRKSAASAKPVTKAASSVHIQSTGKSPAKKGLFSKAAAQPSQKGKAASTSGGANVRTNSQYYTPPTAEYKRWRRIWWVCLVSAIAMTALSWGARMWFPDNEMIGFFTLGVAYVLIISALAIDFVKIRKIRRNYQESMEASKTKASKAESKRMAAEEALKQAEAEAAAAEKAAEKAAKRASNPILSRLPGNKASEADSKAADTSEAGDSKTESTEKKGK